MKKIFRLKAIVPLSLFLVMSLVINLLLLDGIARRAIEFVGSQITSRRSRSGLSRGGSSSAGWRRPIPAR
ncbi:hypothetical protein ACFL6R_07740 [Gemmatimonadota bacterium]